ncbi:MAG: helix-turn-helix transcriptional regulator [Dehalococcoidales bacterium]|nr:MAG: helix-turn-helix transcriptional regulator [Dehalococcoidales bacterium]
MLVKTRVFTMYNGEYRNLSELAEAMGISVSQIYRVREGKRQINQKFIVGAIKAFPNHRLDDLFYLIPDSADEGNLPHQQLPAMKSTEGPNVKKRMTSTTESTPVQSPKTN